MFKKFLFFQKSIKKTFTNHFKKYFLSKNIAFALYQDKIIVTSIFLFICSSFLYKKKQEKFYHFNWKIYLKIFSEKYIHEILICSIKYIIENHQLLEKNQKIEQHIPKTDMSFIKQYCFFLFKKNTSSYALKENINFLKYKYLIEEAIKISEIVLHKIDKTPESVIDLISLVSTWKQYIFEMFGNKSEYIVYLFFVNLKK